MRLTKALVVHDTPSSKLARRPPTMLLARRDPFDFLMPLGLIQPAINDYQRVPRKPHSKGGFAFARCS